MALDFKGHVCSFLDFLNHTEIIVGIKQTLNFFGIGFEGDVDIVFIDRRRCLGSGLISEYENERSTFFNILDGVVDGSVGIAVVMISLDNLFMFDGRNGILGVDKKDE